MNQVEFEKFQGILGEILGADAGEIVFGRSLVGYYGADSLALFQIMLRLETEFGMVIEEKELDNWNKVDDVWASLSPL